MEKCWWRDTGPRGGPWLRGYFHSVVCLGQGSHPYRIIVVAKDGSIIPCEQNNVTVVTNDHMKIRWDNHLGPF